MIFNKEICMDIHVEIAKLSVHASVIKKFIMQYTGTWSPIHIHKRFPTRDFAGWAYILDCGESKKGCLNYFRNRSAYTYCSTFAKYKG